MSQKQSTSQEKRILRHKKHRSDALQKDFYLNNENTPSLETREEVKKTAEMCFVCCGPANRWVNCRNGGIYTKNRRRQKESNNPICKTCIKIICNNPNKTKRACPLCRATDWTKILDVRYPKHKLSWAERQVIIEKKRRKKLEEQLERFRSYSRWIRKGRFGTCPWYISTHGGWCEHCGDDREYHHNVH